MLINNQEKRKTWMENTTSRSNTTSAKKEWSALWSVKVLSKVCNFLWLLTRHSLPSRYVLHHMYYVGKKILGDTHYLSAT
jgi:hypothetical protein